MDFTYLNENGYQLVKNVFNRGDAADIREASYKVLDQGYFKENFQMKNNKPALLFWAQDCDLVLWEYANHKKLKDIVFAYLGPDVRQLNNQVYFRESGDEDEFAWHQDISFRTPKSDYKNIESKYLQTIIIVDGMDASNGAIEFIPGSQTRGDLNIIPRDNSENGLRKFDRMGWHGEKVVAEPGDVLIWSVLTIHSSEKNNSGRNRMNYMNGFCAEDAILNKTRFPIYAR